MTRRTYCIIGDIVALASIFIVVGVFILLGPVAYQARVLHNQESHHVR